MERYAGVHDQPGPGRAVEQLVKQAGDLLLIVAGGEYGGQRGAGQVVALAPLLHRKLNHAPAADRLDPAQAQTRPSQPSHQESRSRA